ncbi:MAG: IS1634 family transposase [Candidatus Eisenbacteria bacterium]|nr:IS1634 family transposase [Candidatus Eisenbacteria bacterium]
MYVRVKTVKTKNATHEYLQLVTSSREGHRVIQRVVATIGRKDHLQLDGTIDRLVESLGRYTERVTVLDALKDGQIVAEQCPEWGPALVFDRLWEEVGLGPTLRRLALSRGFQFDVERVAFAMALQRLVQPKTGSDRNGLEWLRHCRIARLTDERRQFEIELQHFYRTTGFLAQHKEGIESALWDRGRDLFNYQVDVALFDTTSVYFEGRGPIGLAEFGKSKDGKYDCRQVVVGVVLSGDGWPLCTEIWPGNMSDKKTVVPILDALKKRFQIRQVIFVADRGMVSKANLEAVQDAGYNYIIGCKMRGDKEVRDKVLARPGRYHEVADNLRVKEVWIGEHRYIICHNPQEEERDRQDREKILSALRDKIVGQSAKKLTGNRGYKRFLKTPPRGTIEIDEASAEQDARYDGKYVLRTSTDWTPEQLALAYKSLWQVERFFRDYKGLIDARPIYHHKVDNVRGHLVGSFLSLYLAVALRKRLARLGEKEGRVEWNPLMQDLREVRAVHIQIAGRAYLVRTELRGQAHLAFSAVGMKPPMRVQPQPTSDDPAKVRIV